MLFILFTTRYKKYRMKIIPGYLYCVGQDIRSMKLKTFLEQDTGKIKLELFHCIFTAYVRILEG